MSLNYLVNTLHDHCPMGRGLSTLWHSPQENVVRAVPFKMTMGGWAGCLLKCHGEGGVQKKMKCHGEGGSDEYFSVDHGKLDVMGRRGHQKSNVGGWGGWKKHPAHPPIVILNGTALREECE